jgi:two-component system chemotaxis response regulator CheY
MGSASMPRVLVVDDEEAITYIFERYLSLAGYDVAVANNGRDALRAFQSRRADLVITDFRMPGMDGGELIDRLRDVAPDLPALLISANPIDIGTMPDGVRFFAKPVSMADLLARVACMLG